MIEMILQAINYIIGFFIVLLGLGRLYYYHEVSTILFGIALFIVGPLEDGLIKKHPEHLEIINQVTSFILVLFILIGVLI